MFQNTLSLSLSFQSQSVSPLLPQLSAVYMLKTLSLSLVLPPYISQCCRFMYLNVYNMASDMRTVCMSDAVNSQVLSKSFYYDTSVVHKFSLMHIL